MPGSPIGLTTLGSLSIFLQAASAIAAPSCEQASGIALPGLTVTSVVHVDAGKLDLKDLPAEAKDLPAFCRVVGTINPRPKSEIRFETWLPDDWNGRYLQAGNGGFAGSIAYGGLIAGLKNKFAVTNQDGGHRSEGADMSWALQSSEILEDFGNKALYETAKVSKELVAAFYGKPAHHSYFSGCSDGGRESLMSLQRYPEQFDGWVVGAPENDFTRELSSELVLTQTSRLAKKRWTSQHLGLVAQQSREQCDLKDGVKDGIVSDPRDCSPDIDAMVCKANGTAGCLPSDVAAAVKASYRGLPGSKSHPPLNGLEYVKGAEDDPDGWSTWMSDVDGKGAGWHEPYAQEYFGNFVYNNKKLDLSTLDPAKAYKDAFDKASRHVDAIDTDLSRQRAAGKKVLQFHGWSDVGIPVAASIDYYTEVEKDAGGSITDFYRLFLAPGVGHCGGGPGPNYFGQTSDAHTPFDPSHHVLAAVVAWVEKGQAPDSIIATKHKNNDPASAIEMQRPICVFPKVTRYKGAGSPKDAGSFECQ
jgi:feruloyl esterase